MTEKLKLKQINAHLLDNNNINDNDNTKWGSIFTDEINPERQGFPSLFDQRCRRLCFYALILWFTYFYPLVQAFIYFDTGVDTNMYITLTIFACTVSLFSVLFVYVIETVPIFQENNGLMIYPRILFFLVFIFCGILCIFGSKSFTDKHCNWSINDVNDPDKDMNELKIQEKYCKLSVYGMSLLFDIMPFIIGFDFGLNMFKNIHIRIITHCILTLLSCILWYIPYYNEMNIDWNGAIEKWQSKLSIIVWIILMGILVIIILYTFICFMICYNKNCIKPYINHILSFLLLVFCGISLQGYEMDSSNKDADFFWFYQPSMFVPMCALIALISYDLVHI